MADFFVVCSASSARGVKTVADNIEKTLKDEKIKILGVEGYTHKNWILIDSADVVAHIFHSPVRDFYDIEGLYIDSPRIELTFDTKVPQSDLAENTL